jgi:Carboxypeptidase regulatory-like domain
MKRILFALLVVGLGTALTCSTAWAQATAQITGTVKDQSGAVLPGVEITATQTETGVARTTVTNETGTFALPNLVTGPYKLEAALPGFRTFVQTGILLQVNANIVVNPTLEVGQVTEQVQVEANVAQVETRSNAVGQVIENARILELPLNGRQVTDLITLSGAAVQVGTGAAGPGGIPGNSTVQISIAGGLNFGVGYSLDGAMHIDMYNGANHPMPFPDALQEFKVEASGISAAGGMRSGGGVNAVTKSGTNDYHGDLFEFVRNYKFNARNFFAAKRDTLKRNQYGGTLGGPIVKNKLFFFGGYQGTKTRSDPNDTISYVPTAAMLAGDFTTFASAACGRAVTLGAPFVNNRVNPALLSPAAVKVAARLPAAQNDCGQITWGSIEKINEQQFVGKVDYQKSDKNSVFGRYVATTYVLPAPRSFQDNVLTSVTHGRDVLAQSYALGDTYLVSASTVNAFRLAVNRTAHKRYHAPNFSVADVGVNSYTSFKDRIDINVTGGFVLGGNSFATFRTTAYQMSDDLNMVHGTHQMSIGFNLAHWRTNQFAATRAVGQYSFSGSATGLGMADFLTGRLTTLEHGTDTAWASRDNYATVYVADVWKVKPRLTLNYGLRWEPYFSLDQNLGVPYHFDYALFQQGVKSKIYPQAPAGFRYPGDEGFPATGGPMENIWLVFNPRVGFAWDVEGNGRTSVRASAGRATDFTISQLFGGGASAPPWGFRVNATNPSGGFDNPWSDYPGGSPVPYTPGSGKFDPFAIFAGFMNYKMKQPVVESWNLSIQRELASNWVASASYIGSTSLHIWALQARNNAVYFPGAPINGVCTAQGYTLRTTGTTCSTTNNTDNRRRLYLERPQDGQFIGVLNDREDGGTGNYHGMLLSIQRRAASGVNFGANYTLSHCIGLLNIFNNNEGGEYENPNDRDFDRGNCDSDRRHVLNLTAVAPTPEFTNHVLHRVASGWRLSGIYRFSTGQFLTAIAGEDRALMGDSRCCTVQRPDQVAADVYTANKGYQQYLNPAAFARPPLGTLGNMRPANIQGPSTFQFDAALSREFRVKEAQKLEFRAEAFNLTNSLRLGTPQMNFRNSRFGQITSSLNARIMQFALKYLF